MNPLIVTPAYARIEVGEQHRFVASDETGGPLSDVQWSIEPQLAKLHNENGKLRIEGTQVGRAVITAAARGRTASAVVSIVASGTSLSAQSASPPSSVAAPPAADISDTPQFVSVQNSPCKGQPRSLEAATLVFNQARLPSPDELSGTWAAIGVVYPPPAESAGALNCNGIKLGIKFASVIVAKGYSLEIDSLWTDLRMATFQNDGSGSLTFTDSGRFTKNYECRLTQRGTLLCLSRDPLGNSSSDEFRKMVIEDYERYRPLTGAANVPTNVLLQGLRAPDFATRADVVEEIVAHQEELSRPAVRAALVDLLDRENHEVHKRFADSNGKDGVGEAYGEYTGELEDAVLKIVDWRDEHQVCVLAEVGLDWQTEFEYEVVNNAGALAAPCVLRLSMGRAFGNQETGIVLASDRSDSIPALAHIAAVAKNLSPELQQQVHEAILGGLQDPDAAVRAETAEALGKYGGAEMIPILKNMASTDPFIVTGRRTADQKPYFWVREEASKAVESIQKRSGQH